MTFTNHMMLLALIFFYLCTFLGQLYEKKSIVWKLALVKELGISSACYDKA